MKNQKIKFLIIALAGIALSIISIYGYELGIARRESFGAFQWAGTILGFIMFIYGLVKLFTKKR